MTRNTRLARECGMAWYSVEARYRTAIVAAKMLTPTMLATPWGIALRTRTGVTASTARKPIPWLTLFAISSPRRISLIADDIRLYLLAQVTWG